MSCPVAIAGAPANDYLDRWCDLLARYGSPRLRASVGRYRSAVIELLREPVTTRLPDQPAAAETTSGALVGLDALPAAL